MKMAARKGGHQSHNHEHDDDRFDDMEKTLNDEHLQEIYQWVDGIPLTRPKKNINRDFSDGVLVAEILSYSFDKLVELHNYVTASKVATKIENWNTLNRKVFCKLNFQLGDDIISDLCSCRVGVIEKVLMMLKSKIDRAKYFQERSHKPESEQYEHVSPGRKQIKAITDGGKKGKQEVKDWNAKNASKDRKLGAQARTQQPGGVKGQKGQGIPKKRVGNVAEPDTVPRYFVEEKEQEVLSRDETINMLNEKIDKLDYLLKLKDLKIFELKKLLQERTEANYEYQYNQVMNSKPRYYTPK